jgi:hypothetical protein
MTLSYSISNLNLVVYQTVLFFLQYILLLLYAFTPNTEIYSHSEKDGHKKTECCVIVSGILNREIYTFQTEWVQFLSFSKSCTD